MIAIISFFARAVNHSIRGLAGTLYATRPVAMHCLRLADLIRRLPSGILSPPRPIHLANFCFSSQFHLNFNMLYVSVSLNTPIALSRVIYQIHLICLKNVTPPYNSTGSIEVKFVNSRYSHMVCLIWKKCFISTIEKIPFTLKFPHCLKKHFFSLFFQLA